MAIIFILEFILKAVLVAFGILAWQGTRWAFVSFLVVLGVMAVADIALTLLFLSINRAVSENEP